MLYIYVSDRGKENFSDFNGWSKCPWIKSENVLVVSEYDVFIIIIIIIIYQGALSEAEELIWLIYSGHGGDLTGCSIKCYVWEGPHWMQNQFRN